MQMPDPSPVNDNDALSLNIYTTQEKTTAKKTYIVYLITVKYNGKVWLVKRRYTEFKLLDDALREEFPAISSVWKFPPKKFLGNLKESFVAQRKQQLQNYLNELIQHREAIASSVFGDFINIHSVSSLIDEKDFKRKQIETYQQRQQQQQQPQQHQQPQHHQHQQYQTFVSQHRQHQQEQEHEQEHEQEPEQEQEQEQPEQQLQDPSPQPSPSQQRHSPHYKEEMKRQRQQWQMQRQQQQEGNQEEPNNLWEEKLHRKIQETRRAETARVTSKCGSCGHENSLLIPVSTSTFSIEFMCTACHGKLVDIDIPCVLDEEEEDQ